MNVKKAIKTLKRKGISVLGEKDNWIIDHYYEEPYTDRGLINFAKIYTSDYGVPGGRDVKHFRHRNNRQQTREWLKHEQYENFSTNMLAKDEDVWNWD